ncbi:MAG: hypothetical protein ACLRZ2_03060 [Veillonella sp.]
MFGIIGQSGAGKSTLIRSSTCEALHLACIVNGTDLTT